MYFGTPQIIYIVLSLLGLGMSIAKHGKEKLVRENAIITIIVDVIAFTLLYYGGFFTK